MMELTRLKKNWETLGRLDPMWAILSDPTKKGRKWDPAGFFKSGEADINGLLGEVTAMGFPLLRGTALDFGCGIGRLTQALCNHFGNCYGVDISSTMLDQAKQYNRFGSACIYALNDSPDLHLFEANSFDFIYSNIVLQHIPPDAGKNYISEFVRVMKSGGLLIFQVPSTLRIAPDQAAVSATIDQPKQAAKRNATLDKIRGVYSSIKAKLHGEREDVSLEQLIDMYGIPREEVVKVLEGAGGKVLRVQEYNCAGPAWLSFRYWVTKPSEPQSLSSD
jgi:SAM-dependent methyltransferase